MPDYRDVPLVLRHSAAIRAGDTVMAVPLTVFFRVALGAGDPVGIPVSAAPTAVGLLAASAAFRERVELRPLATLW